jgi:hypothetical protein
MTPVVPGVVAVPEIGLLLALMNKVPMAQALELFLCFDGPVYLRYPFERGRVLG